MKTTRQALRALCKGKADEQVSIHRRPLRWLVDLAEAAEEYRRAQNDLALLHVAGEFGDPMDEAITRGRAAQAVLDDHLTKLKVPA